MDTRHDKTRGDGTPAGPPAAPGRARAEAAPGAAAAVVTPVPRARLRPPPLRALGRDRLLLAMAPGDHRLTLITGPAGAGKTTLLAQLVAADDRPTVWYQVDAGDTRVPVLLHHLARALAPVVPGLDQGCGSVELMADLLEDAAVDHALLALDDLHVLAGTAAEEALGRLVELAPPWLQVAATCRQPPRWNLSRLRVSGALLEVGADDLRFRAWEVERLFGDLYGEPLPPGDLAQLTRALEGWAAGLQLFHLATRGKPASERRRAVASLPARSKLIREYLTGNVLDELPDPLRTFLVDTSVLGHLSPVLCDELRGRADSRELLADLEARGAFVSHDEDGTYRCHEVFRTYLEGRLVDRDGQARARAWWLRAAELLEADGRPLEALRAYCRAGDWPSVGRVLDTSGAELVEDSVSWLDWLPPGLIEEDPWAMLAAARRAAAVGRFAVAVDLYSRAEQIPGSAVVAEICRRERSGLAAWVDPAAPPSRGWGGRMRAAARSRPGELTSVAPGDEADGQHAGRVLAAGVARLLVGDMRGAARLLAGPVDDPAVDPAVAASARVALATARLLGTGGSVPEVEELPELVELAQMPWLSWLARAARGLGGSPDGVRHAHEVADALDRQGDRWGSAVARMFAALGSLVTGGSPAAELTELCARLRDLDAAVLACWCQAWRSTALARQGAPEAATVAAAAERAAERVGVPGARVWAATVQAQLAAVACDPVAAQAHDDRAAGLRSSWSIDVVVLPLAGDPAGPGPSHGEGIGAGDPADLAALDGLSGAPVGVGAAGKNGTGGNGHVAGPPAVRLRCFGGLHLEIAGRPVDLKAVKPRARAALRLLAAHAGQPLHVESMVDSLWPDVDLAGGKRNLQVALSSLRRLLDEHEHGAGALVDREDHAYVLRLPPGAEADVVAFAAGRDEARAAARGGRGAAAVAAGERALAAYGGDLLPEEGPADWAVEARRNLGQDAADVAQLVAEHALALDRPEVAVAACTRGLDIDRYSDGLWRLLTAAHERGGDRAAAARSQERYQALLRDLGVAAP